MEGLQSHQLKLHQVPVLLPCLNFRFHRPTPLSGELQILTNKSRLLASLEIFTPLWTDVPFKIGRYLGTPLLFLPIFKPLLELRSRPFDPLGPRPDSVQRLSQNHVVPAGVLVLFQ